MCGKEERANDFFNANEVLTPISAKDPKRPADKRAMLLREGFGALVILGVIADIEVTEDRCESKTWDPSLDQSEGVFTRLDDKYLMIVRNRQTKESA